jgi:hypothetical protein
MRKSVKLTQEQAYFVLITLISAGKFSMKRVRDVLRKRDQEIKSIRQRIAELEAYGVGGARRRGTRTARKVATSAPTAEPATGAEAATSKRRKLPPKILAFRRKQGTYMGLVRQLSAAEKARVRTVREKNGIVAAIKLAKSLAA